MHVAYLLSVWIHILAAAVWIGGMSFVALVAVPWLRQNRSNAGPFLRDTGLRFRSIGWACFGILALTGTFNLWMRGVRAADLTSSDWLAAPFGRALVLKLGLFATVLGVSALHDFVVGPQATSEIERDPRSPRANTLRRQASLLGRANVVLALAVVALAVVLVRGWP